MRVRALIEQLEQLEPDAIVDVIVMGESFDIEYVEAGVVTPSNPHGWADIILRDSERVHR